MACSALLRPVLLGTVASVGSRGLMRPARRLTASVLVAAAATGAGSGVVWAVNPSPSPTPANAIVQLFGNPTPAIAPAISFPQGSGGVVSGTLTPVSPPSSPLTYTVPAQPARGSVAIDPVSGSFTYTPAATARHAAAAPGGTTTDSFTVSVSDGYGGTAAVPVTVPIAPVNAPPVVTGRQVTAPAKATGTVRGTVTAQDPDGDPLSYAVATRPAKGSVTVNPGGAFTYTPTAAARRSAAAAPASSPARTDAFTVTVNDGHGGTTAVPVRVPIR